MISPDVNILIYAARADTARHAECLAWLDAARRGPQTLILFEPVLASTLRLLTNRRVFVDPTPAAKTLAFIQALMDSPAVRLARAGDRHFEVFLDLVRKADCRGDLVQDAYLAALAIEHGCEWITTDRDFARFPGLRWRLPGG